MRKQILALVAVTILLIVTSAFATPIRLDTNIQPDNSGDATIQTWLVSVIGAYNGTHNPDLSTSSLDVTSYDRWNQGDPAQGSYPMFGADVLSITLPSDLNTYLVLHWGGRGGGVYQAFALDNQIEFDTFVAPGQNGLSWYELFGAHEYIDPHNNPVPEPGTMMLLGVGMFGLAIFGKRRMNKES